MIIAGSAKLLSAAVHAQSGSAQTATGTIYCVAKLELAGDADDGKYWDIDGADSWQASPTTWPSATHTQAGVWQYLLPAAATTGKAGGTIAYTFTDNLTEASATTVCGGGEHRINLEDPVTTVDVLQANVAQISGDATAADNLEATFDGSGYTDDNAPAKQSQVASISISGAAVNVPASAFAQTTGTVSGGTISNTDQLNGVFHTLADAAGTLDAYYEFDVGADGVPTQAGWNGYVQSGNDSIEVFARNWGGSSWDQIGQINGASGTTVVSQLWTLLTRHVGSGADAGKVRIRFQSTGLTSSVTATDRIYVSYSIVRRSVGYSFGAIWVDTLSGTAGTVPYTNGTADLPCLTWANALSLSAALGIRRFRVINGSTITLTSSSDYLTIDGEEWILALNGQSCTFASFAGAHVTGTATGTNLVFKDCKIALGGTLTVPDCEAHNCSLAGDIVLTGAGTNYFHKCYSGVAGTATPSIDFGAAVGSTNLNMRDYSGGVEIKNMGQSGTDKMSYEGNGQLVIASSCVGGTIAIRGNFTVTDNASGAVTLSQNARIDVQQIRDAMKLAPTVGTPTAESVDAHLDTLLTASAPSVGDIADAVCDELLAGHTTPGSVAATLTALVPASGSNTVTITVQDGSAVPVPGVSVSIYDATNTAFQLTATTDPSGQVVCALDDATYKVRLVKAGYTFTTPETMVVSGTTAKTITATAWAPSAPSAVDLCVVYGTLVDAGGNPLVGAIIEARTAIPDVQGGYRLVNPKVTATTDSDGYFELELVRLASVNVICTPAGIRETLTVPDAASVDFSTWGST